MYRCNSSVCVIYNFFTGVSTTRQECMFRDLPTRGNSTHTARQSRIIASRPGPLPRGRATAPTRGFVCRVPRPYH